MTLPDLPKKYNRREAKVDGLVAAWFLKNHPLDVLLEVKMKGGKVLDHQKVALRQVEKGKFMHKFPDMGRKTPADYVILKKADSALCFVDGKDVECVINNEYKVNFKI